MARPLRRLLRRSPSPPTRRRFAGGPISDDYLYLMNPWVRGLSAASLPELFDPRSQATLALNNYAPLRPILHGVEWRLFYDESSIAATNRRLPHRQRARARRRERAAGAAARAGRAALRRGRPRRRVLPAASRERRGGRLALRAVERRRAGARVRRAAAAAPPAAARARCSSRSRCSPSPRSCACCRSRCLRQWAWRREPGARARLVLDGRLARWSSPPITGAELLTFFESASGARARRCTRTSPSSCARSSRSRAAIVAMAVTGFGVGGVPGAAARRLARSIRGGSSVSARALAIARARDRRAAARSRGGARAGCGDRPRSCRCRRSFPSSTRSPIATSCSCCPA